MEKLTKSQMETTESAAHIAVACISTLDNIRKMLNMIPVINSDVKSELGISRGHLTKVQESLTWMLQDKGAQLAAYPARTAENKEKGFVF